MPFSSAKHPSRFSDLRVWQTAAAAVGCAAQAGFALPRRRPRKPRAARGRGAPAAGLPVQEAGRKTKRIHKRFFTLHNVQPVTALCAAWVRGRILFSGMRLRRTAASAGIPAGPFPISAGYAAKGGRESESRRLRSLKGNGYVAVVARNIQTLFPAVFRFRQIALALLNGAADGKIVAAPHNRAGNVPVFGRSGQFPCRRSASQNGYCRRWS